METKYPNIRYNMLSYISNYYFIIPRFLCRYTMTDTLSLSRDVLMGTTTLPLQLNNLPEVALDGQTHGHPTVTKTYRAQSMTYFWASRCSIFCKYRDTPCRCNISHTPYTCVKTYVHSKDDSRFSRSVQYVGRLIMHGRLSMRDGEKATRERWSLCVCV